MHCANNNLLRMHTYCGGAHFMQRPLIYFFTGQLVDDRWQLNSRQNLNDQFHDVSCLPILDSFHADKVVVPRRIRDF